jgi:hypothetical protein
MLQGDRRHAGTPEDGVISREQIAQVLVSALTNDEAKNKTFELVAERGKHSRILPHCLQTCGLMIHKKMMGFWTWTICLCVKNLSALLTS